MPSWPPPPIDFGLLDLVGLGATLYRVIDDGADFAVDNLNRITEHIEGVDRDEVVGRRISDLSPQALDRGYVACLQEVWRGGVAVDFPDQPAPSPFEGWRRTRAIPVGPDRLLVVFRDVTAEHEALSQRDEANERHRLLTETMTDGLWDWDVAARTLYLSPSWKAHLGYAPDELPNAFATFQDLLHPDDRDRVLYELEASHTTRWPHWESEFRLRHRDGHHTWVLARGSVVRDDDGRARRMLGVHIDIDARKRAEAERDAALEEHHLLARVMSTTEDLMSFVDRDYVYRVVNDAYLELHQLQHDDIVGKPVREVMGGTTFDLVVKPELDRCFAGEVVRYQATFTYAGDDRRRMDVQYTPYVAIDGEVGGAVVTARDISDLYAATQRLRQDAAVFRSTTNGVVITDLEGTILDVNDAFTKVTGYAHAEAVGHNPRLLKSDRHDTGFYEAMFREIARSGSWTGEVWNRRKNGEEYPESLTISVVRSEDGTPTGYVGVFSDITETKVTAQRLEHLATHDPLTRLPNRRLLHERLSQAVRLARRDGHGLAVAFLDLDAFKLINDGLGHRMGDRLLQVVAERLRSIARASDTIARQSGDEFIGVFQYIDTPTQASRVVQRLMTVFRQPVDLGGTQVHPTCSVGLSLFPADGDNADELLRNADAAMYAAKDAGRNTWAFYDRGMTARAREDMLLASALRRAVRDGGLSLAYQPMIDLRSGLPDGVEALARWEQPAIGPVPPDRFIPVAEQSGLMVELGTWVVDEACRQLAAWRRAGQPVPRMSINISAHQLAAPDFVDQLYDTLARHKIPAPCVQLELTETTMMTRLDEHVARLEALHDMGISLAIDDFGTGYSSIAYLKQLPIDVLKIDRSFVRDIHADPDDRAIVEAIVEMAHALELKVVAEGVESQEHLDFLRRVGCDVIQGYLTGRPVPAERLRP